MQDLSSVMTSKSSMSRIDRVFSFLNPDKVGGFGEVADFLDVLAFEGFGSGGGGGSADEGGGM